MNKKKLYKLTVCAVMSALGTVIYMLLPEIPLVPAVDYLKLDLSDIPAIISGVLCGPLYGVTVGVIKNLFHLTRTTTYGIGELMNVGIVAAMILPLCSLSGVFSRLFKKDRLSAAVYFPSAVCAVAVTVLAGWLLNALLTPLFYAIVGIPITAKSVLAGVTASTLLNSVKAALNLLPFYPVYFAVFRAFVKFSD